MSIEKDLLNSNRTWTKNLMALVEETHYPEDDFVVNELIKTLSKQSREFAKTYKDFMDQVKTEIIKWIIK